ncbi:MAG: glycosyltransferase family 87 protein [Candidatus Limnocylindrales bacterium]
MDRAVASPPLVTAGRHLAESPWMHATLRVVLVVLALAVVLAVFVIEGQKIASFGFDARSYWGFPRADPYAGSASANGLGVFRYAPAFLPLLSLFSLLDWSSFSFLWFCLLAGTYFWLAGRWWLLALAFAPIAYELYMGNVHLLLAAAIVLGFRYPATWAFVLLTKVTPGVGLLWFAVRREWGSLLVALGVTGAIVGAGLLLAPGTWQAWFASLAGTAEATGPNHVPLPLPVRLAGAALIVIWGARTDRRWTVVVAATLGLPTLWDHGWSMLIGVVPLVDPRWATDSPAARLRRRLARPVPALVG